MAEADASVQSGRTTAGDGPPRRPRRPAEGRVDALASRVEDLLAVLKTLAAKPTARKVHKLRTTIRRVEALLPASDDQARRARKQLDRIRRRAGKVRDLDVHLQALGRLARDSASAEGRAIVRDALVRTRAKRLKRLTRRIASERDRRLAKRLRQAAGRAPAPAGADDPRTVLTAVTTGFATALREAGPLGPENLHPFRIEAKHLRYLAETALPDAAAATAVAELTRVQDAIGTWHDWLTLGARVEDVLGPDAPLARPLCAAVAGRTERALARALGVTSRVARRLRALAPTPARKGVRPLRPRAGSAPMPSVGASA
jgi:CHAD domain-containing protein